MKFLIHASIRVGYLHAFSHLILTAIYEVITDIYIVLFKSQTIFQVFYIYIHLIRFYDYTFFDI